MALEHGAFKVNIGLILRNVLYSYYVVSVNLLHH